MGPRFARTRWRLCPPYEAIRVSNFCCGRTPLGDGNLTRRERLRSKLQNLGPGRDFEHDAAPFAVEAGKNGTQIVLCR